MMGGGVPAPSIDSNILPYQHILRRKTNLPHCHSERQRRISRVGHRDSSLTLRMTSTCFPFYLPSSQPLLKPVTILCKHKLSTQS